MNKVLTGADVSAVSCNRVVASWRMRSLAFSTVSTLLYFTFIFTFCFSPFVLGMIDNTKISVGIIVHPLLILTMILLSGVYTHLSNRIDKEKCGADHE